MDDTNEKQQPPVVDYEVRMKDGTEFWLREASDFFYHSGGVHRALKLLARSLDLAGIPYAVAGALALGPQGFVRVTVDIDVLLTREGLDKFHRELVGKGYRPTFEGARKRLRCTDTGVKIDVLITGEYPGDGQPKPVVFPDPSEVSFEQDGIRYIRLDKLIELKLASGISAQHRGRDLVDIQDLIKEAKLPLDLAEELDPSVREAYRDLWHKAQMVDPLEG
jgi:hypothetical protein